MNGLCATPCSPPYAAREQVQEHAEIDRLADSGWAQAPPRIEEAGGGTRIDSITLDGQEARTARVALVRRPATERTGELAGDRLYCCEYVESW